MRRGRCQDGWGLLPAGCFAHPLHSTRVVGATKGREMLELAKVRNFGAIDADADALLRDCFQDHTAYVEAMNLETFLILGRKGSGKTAIFRKIIQSREAGIFAYGHSFDDYPWAHHDLQAETGVPEERRYVHS